MEEALKNRQDVENPVDPIVQQFNADDAAFVQLHKEIDDEIQESTRPSVVWADLPAERANPLPRETANHMTMERAIRNVLDAQEYLRATHGVYMTWEMRK